MKQYLSLQAEDSEISIMGFAAISLAIKEKLEPGFFKSHLQETYLNFSNAISGKDMSEKQIYFQTERIFSVMNFFMQFMANEDYFHKSLGELEHFFQDVDGELKADYLKYLSIKKQAEF